MLHPCSDSAQVAAHGALTLSSASKRADTRAEIAEGDTCLDIATGREIAAIVVCPAGVPSGAARLSANNTTFTGWPHNFKDGVVVGLNDDAIRIGKGRSWCAFFCWRAEATGST